MSKTGVISQKSMGKELNLELERETIRDEKTLSSRKGYFSSRLPPLAFLSFQRLECLRLPARNLVFFKMALVSKTLRP